MAKIIKEGLAKADSVVLQPGFTTRFLVTSKKSTRGTPKSTTGETQETSKSSEEKRS